MTAISLANVSKYYPLLDSAAQGLSYLFRYALGDTRSVEKVNHVKALRDIDLDVAPGERVGLIGRNGSGKTTLLKLVGGEFSPTSGSLRINGELYYLGAGTIGLDTELTGRQGIEAFLRERGTAEHNLPTIVGELESFLELHEYFDQPIKHYSLGMRARTEFAAATAIAADIILIDEILGAGDLYWAEKCSRRMEQLCQQGRTMLIVSHSLGQILRFCERAVWLDVGRIVMDGPVQAVVRRYEAFLENLSWKTADLDDKAFDVVRVAHEISDVTLPRSGAAVMRWPARGDVLISGVWINDSSHTVVNLPSGQILRIRFTIECRVAGDYALRYLISLWSPTGKRIGVVENDVDRVELALGEARDIEVSVPAHTIGPGLYALTFSLFQLTDHSSSANDQDTRQDVIYKSYQLQVEPDSSAKTDRQPALFSLQFAVQESTAATCA